MPMPEPPKNLVPDCVEVKTADGYVLNIWASEPNEDAWVETMKVLADITAGRYSLKVESWVESSG